MWSTTGLFITALLFQVGAVGPVVAVGAVCGLTAVAVVPAAHSWAQS